MVRIAGRFWGELSLAAQEPQPLPQPLFSARKMAL
jgi:hypothetical protein